MPESESNGLLKRVEELEHELAELRLTEDQLREKESRYRSLLEHTFDGIAIHNGRELMDANSVALAMMGADDISQVVGRPVLDFLHPRYHDFFIERQETMKQPGTVFSLEEEILLRFDGSELEVELTGIATKYQGQDCVMVVFRDISKKKRSERQLRDSEYFHKLILNAISDTVIITDDLGHFTFVSPNVREMFGYSYDEVEKLGNIDKLVCGCNHILQEYERKGEIRNRECDITTKNGEKRTILLSVGKVSILGGTRLVTCHDITERKAAQEQARATSERLKAIIESIEDGFLALNEDIIVTEMNRSAEEMLDVSREMVVGNSAYEMFQDLHGSEYEKQCLKALHEKKRVVFEMHDIIYGQMKWIEIRVFPFKQGIAVFFRDTTDRKRAEQVLKESEERLDLAFNAANVGSWDWDINTGKLIVNEHYATMLGCTLDEIGNSLDYWKNGLHPDDKDRSLVVLERHISGGTEAYINEFRLKTKSGGWKWIMSRGKIVDRNDDGSPRRMIGVHIDITEFKTAEQKISDIARFPAENINPVMRFTNDGILTFANPASNAVLVVWGIDVGDNAPQELKNTIRDAAESGEVQTIEIQTDGTYYSLVVTPVKGTGYTNVYGHNTTDLHKAQLERERFEKQIQQAQKLESLGILAGGIAHDFNNLLVGILGNADLALMDLSPSSPVHEMLDEIKRSAVRASELTNQMLAYSGKGRFVVKAMNINDLVTEMTHILEVSISQKATLSLSLFNGIPEIDADITQMRQVIMNLVTNASDALGEGRGMITISTAKMRLDREYLSGLMFDENLPEGTYVCLEVSDTGEGMDAETTKKIFDPFFTTKFTGRGLGLSAVMGIVRGHKGAIKVYSEPGKGTTIKVVFPAIYQDLAEEKKEISGSITKGSETLLIIDDEPSVRTVVRKMMERFGYTVLTAAGGREGIDIFTQQADTISCVLLDMTMPELSGDEVFHELRKIRNDVPVILASGFNEQDATTRFAGKGLSGFIQKPFQLEMLLNTLKDVLGR